MDNHHPKDENIAEKLPSNSYSVRMKNWNMANQDFVIFHQVNIGTKGKVLRRVTITQKVHLCSHTATFSVSQAIDFIAPWLSATHASNCTGP